MLKSGKKRLFKAKAWGIAFLSKNLMRLLLWTCRVQVEGVEQFCQLATKEKCMLALWHNRLAIAPFILNRYTPRFIYAALVSASRDGEILSTIVHSYQNGRTIRVSHQARYQALRTLVRHVEERKEIVIITPDGPRGPRYEVKPGLALAALEAQAHIVVFNWQAKRYWQLKTWDGLRLPKPFTTIQVSFSPVVGLQESSSLSLAQTKEILKEALSKM